MAVELFSGIYSSGEGIAHFAHLGGAVAGFLLLKFGDRFGIFQFFDRITGGKKSAKYDSYQNYVESNRGQSQPTIHKFNPFSSSGNYASPTKTYTSATFVINGEEITQEKLDLILDKISVHGYQNLTEKEKFI